MIQKPSSHWEDIRMQRFRSYTTKDVDREMRKERCDNDRDEECNLNVKAERSNN